LAVVKSWDTIIREQRPPTAMWYTPIISCWGDQTLSPEKPGKNRIVAVARRMRLLFRRAGLPYKSPHKFRHGHAVYCLQRAKDMGDMKAISMNLMHVNTQTTDGIYGPFMESEIQYRISNLNKPQVSLIGFSPESMHFPKGVSDEDLAVMFRAWADRLSTKSMTPS
jgi:integrase